MHHAAPLALALAFYLTQFVPTPAQDWKPKGGVCKLCTEGAIAPSTSPSPSLPLDPLLEASSFRGLKLEMPRWQIAKVLDELGFTLRGLTPADAVMEICKEGASVGYVHFGANDQVRKFEFSPQFFTPSDSILRHFADDMFQRYQIQPDQADDDLCFPGLTCFQGTSPTGERFLIAKITGDVQFQVTSKK